jgi:hypothetical protein
VGAEEAESVSNVGEMESDVRMGFLANSTGSCVPRMGVAY